MDWYEGKTALLSFQTECHLCHEIFRFDSVRP
jgi:hypothetical protein